MLDLRGSSSTKTSLCGRRFKAHPAQPGNSKAHSIPPTVGMPNLHSGRVSASDNTASPLMDRGELAVIRFVGHAVMSCDLRAEKFSFAEINDQNWLEAAAEKQDRLHSFRRYPASPAFDDLRSGIASPAQRPSRRWRSTTAGNSLPSRNFGVSVAARSRTETGAAAARSVEWLSCGDPETAPPCQAEPRSARPICGSRFRLATAPIWQPPARDRHRTLPSRKVR